LQNLPVFVDTAKKVQLIRLWVKSGLRSIEATSFVHPRAIPQFRDAAATIEGVKSLPGVKIIAMVPNLEGASKALHAGVSEITFVFSVSASHNRNNVRKTPEESLSELGKVMKLPGLGSAWTLRVVLATAFGCPFEGILPDKVIYHYLERVVEMGCKAISFADTVGYANPRQVRRMMRHALRHYPDRHFTIHLHNTRGLGLANALTAYEAGLRTFDAAIGGLGGCPYAPGATGNIATEDLVFMFEEMGIKTGVQLTDLLQAAQYLKTILPDVELSSSLVKAGLPMPPKVLSAR